MEVADLADLRIYVRGRDILVAGAGSFPAAPVATRIPA